MRQRMVIAVLSMLLVLVLGLGLSVNAAEYVIKFGLQQAALEEAPEWRATVAFKRYVEAQSGGRIAVNLYPGSQLGFEREMLESVKMGTLEMTFTAEGPLAGHFPSVYVLSIPYVFSTPAIAWEVLDGSFGDEFKEAFLKNTGVRILSYGENGFRHFTNNVRPIKVLEDLQGMKIRVMESPIYIEMVRALGALPTPMAGGGELYNAMQQGVVDGQENPLDQIYTFRFYEVQKYATTDGHTYSPLMLMINENYFNSLPKDLQTVILNGGEIFKTVLRGFKRDLDMRSKELLEEKGMEVYALPINEIERFRQASQGAVISWVEERVDSIWIDKLMDAVSDAESKLIR